MLRGEITEKLLITQDDKNTYLDFRPFGDRQSIAMDLYLREAVEIVRMRNVVVGPAKTLVLVCDSTVELTENARLCIREIQASGESIRMRSTPPR